MLSQCAVRRHVRQLQPGHDTVCTFADSLSQPAADLMLYRSSYVTDQVDAARAPINMVHDNIALKVSQGEAAVAEHEAKRRLLSVKKLSLVVDLDQTVIQATVDPTVGEWQKDPQNPNHDAVKDVRTFQLKDEGPGGNGAWYYIKFRPGLEQFLEDISKLYELHIYTMGTRAYAKHIAEIIDPTRKIFGNRILSRNENYSLFFKSLDRLFPVDTRMVVIIDDRADVWSWTENLIKVTPFDFFVGIGDINASFLPKRQEIPKALPKSDLTPDEQKALGGGEDKTPEPQSDGAEPDLTGIPTSEPLDETSANGISTLDKLVSIGGGSDSTLLQEQTNRQEETIAAQLTDRPLLQKQKALEAEESTAKAAASPNDNENIIPDSATPTESAKSRHHILRDDDRELHHLEKALRRLHTEFFETHTRHLASLQGGRLAQLRPGEKRKLPLNADSDLAVIPDIKVLLPQIKRKVLQDIVLVFSGVKPIQVDPLHFEQAILARQFGAQVEQRVNRRTTHVVAGNPRTAKAKEAFRRNIKVVKTRWLIDSITQWKKLDEAPYLMNYDGADPLVPKDDGNGILSDSEDPPSSLDTEGEDSTAGNDKKRPILSLDINDDEEFDLEGILPSPDFEDNSPVGGDEENWLEMSNELEDYLAEEDSNAENSEAESVASGTASVESNRSVRSIKSTRSNISLRGKKRSRPAPGDSESESESPGKKKRGTTLSQTVVIGEKETGLPTPDITGGEEPKDGLSAREEADEEGDGWSEFSDDLDAEMEKAEKEEQEQG